ncbi:MAG: hypothetical protein ABFS05_01945 [Bacteroidota bacterium]
MYDIKISETSLLYVQNLKKIYARIAIEIIYSYWESAALQDIVVNPQDGDVSKNISMRFNLRGTASSEGRAWVSHHLVEIHDADDDVLDTWTEKQDVRDYIAQKSYEIAAEVYKGGVLKGSTSTPPGTITQNSDIDME